MPGYIRLTICNVLYGLLPIFSIIGCASADWESKAKNQKTCPGRSVEFRWHYDENINHLVGFSIYKAGIPPTTILTKEGNNSAVPKLPRAEYLPNAGLILRDVQIEDSGDYHITAVFDEDKNNLSGNASLEVLSECPDFDELSNPNVSLGILDEFKEDLIENTTCDLKTFARTVTVVLSTTVPYANPEVRAVFRVVPEDGEEVLEYCYGNNSTDTVCSRQLDLTRYDTFLISSSLEYPGYANETNATSFTCTIYNKRNDNIYIVIIIIVLFLILLIVICLVCIVCRCISKRRKRKNAELAGGNNISLESPVAEEAPMVGQSRRPPARAPPPVPETESLADSVDPYSCTCGACPQSEGDGYCCNEIATLNSLLDGYSQRCITQSRYFRAICHDVSLRKQATMAEKLEGAKLGTGKWIWHTPKTTGFPACIESHLIKEFPQNDSSPTAV